MNTKRILCGLLSAAMAITVLGSCQQSGGQSQQGGSSAGGTGSSAPVSSGSTGTDGEYTPVTVFCANTSSMPMNNDVLLIQQLSEITHTQFDFTVSPATGTGEKFNLMMSSGDVPDLVIYVADPILKYYRAFAPLNDLIRDYCPSYEKLMDDNPFLRKDLTSADGNIYTIQSKAAFRFANAFIVRQDWLDTLELEVPTTTEEFYEVLKAFKDGDPNGNGEADEIPLIAADGRRGDAESPGLSMFDASFGIDEDFYVSDDGSEILFGATDPRMKDALAYLNRLYSDGLIDQEYLTCDSASIDGLITENRVGMQIAWGIAVEEAAAIQAENVNLTVILPPVGPDGLPKIYSQMPQTRTNALAVSKDSQVKEHIMSIWDYVFSEEGDLMMNFGVEGTTYNMVDGEPVYTDEILKSDDGPLGGARKFGINSWLPHNQLASAEFGRTAGEGKFEAAVKLYDPYIVDPVPALKFTEEEKSTITSVYEGEIKTYLDESLDGFITGRLPLSDFDSFVAQLEKMGLPDILKIYNDAYQRYQSL